MRREVSESSDRPERDSTKNPQLRGFMYFYDVAKRQFGAEGGTRTHTLLRASDFESDASTNSTTPASVSR